MKIVMDILGTKNYDPFLIYDTVLSVWLSSLSQKIAMYLMLVMIFPYSD